MRFVRREVVPEVLEVDALASFYQAAEDFAGFARTKLPMPVLSIGGEKANGGVLGRQIKLVATDVSAVVLKDTGHWVMEESPKETTEALLKFL